jgi:hypothetical protein
MTMVAPPDVTAANEDQPRGASKPADSCGAETPDRNLSRVASVLVRIGLRLTEKDNEEVPRC